MSYKVTEAVLSAAVANGATFNVSYPAGTDAGHYAGAKGHVLIVNQGKWTHPAFTISFGASNITVTNPGAPIAAGTKVRLQVEIAGTFRRPTFDLSSAPYGTVASFGNLSRVTFGAVSAIAANTVLNATAVAVTTVVTLSTPVTLDVPRAVSIVSSGAGDTTQTITIRGTDAFGAALTETIAANGTTTVNGKKAFKTIISYQASAALAGNLSIGQTKILGLPFRVAEAAQVISHVQDGASATAGTVVAGITTASTATTGDVRGTWSPNGTPNDTIVFAVYAMAMDANDLGVAQFSS